MRLRGAVAAVLLLLALAFLAYRFSMPPRVVVETLSARPIEQHLVATGRVTTRERIQVGALVGGTVAEVLVREGDRVEAQQPLVRLTGDEAQAMVANAEAAVGYARAQLRQLRQVRLPEAGEAREQALLQFEQARRDYQRAASLAEEGYASEAEVEALREALDLAESRLRSSEQVLAGLQPGGSQHQAAVAELARAEAALAEARARRAYTLIAAPAPGIIIRRHVEPGDVVQPGTQVMDLARAGDTLVEAQIDERNLSLLEIGQNALVSADAYPRERFPATLAFIAPAVDPQRGTVEVELLVPDPPPYLRADMTVSVDILVQRREKALTVPRAAVRNFDSAPTVLLIEDDVLVEQAVELGALGDGRVELLSGVEPGAQVVVDSRGQAAGQRVRGAEAAPE